MPDIKFVGPINITSKKCLLCIEKAQKSEYYKDVTIRVEISENFICKGEAIKIDASRNEIKLKISRKNNKLICWESYETPDSKMLEFGKNKIYLYATEIIKIKLDLKEKICVNTIKNVSIIHTKGSISLKDYQSKASIRKYINWKHAIILLIIIVILIIPYAKILQENQKRFLRRCCHDKTKYTNKFDKKYSEIVVKQINKFLGFLDKEEKEFYEVVIKYFYIFVNWDKIPKFCRSLNKTIEEYSMVFCLGIKGARERGYKEFIKILKEKFKCQLIKKNVSLE